MHILELVKSSTVVIKLSVKYSARYPSLAVAKLETAEWAIYPELIHQRTAGRFLGSSRAFTFILQ